MVGKPVALPELSGGGSWGDWLDHFNHVAAVDTGMPSRNFHRVVIPGNLYFG